MAFCTEEFSSLHDMIREVQKIGGAELRAVAENFILEERLTAQRESNYGRYCAVQVGVDGWKDGHEEYVSEKIKSLRGTPETFENINKPNFPDLEPTQYVVRIENLVDMTKIARGDLDVGVLVGHLEKFMRDRSSVHSRAAVEDFLADCNLHRDHRPVFVGFWGEVKDLFDDENSDWPNHLRDRFGLGHFDPMDGEPIPVLLLRYRLSEVVAAMLDESNCVAIPTVLDSSWSPFFFPTPIGMQEGQTLDLSHGGEESYTLGCEILHRHMEYRPEHIYHIGWITQSPGKTYEEARRIHLEYLSDDLKFLSDL